MELDRIDAKILSALQADGRLPMVELADKVGLSPTPCVRRVKAMEDGGAIMGYMGVLSPPAIGLSIMAIVHIKLIGHTDEAVARFEREIERMKEVTSCFAMTC